MFEIEYATTVADDLQALRAYDRQIVLDRIEEQLRHEPLRATRAKKMITGLQPPWEHLEPIWQLRVGEFRVFYDVDEPNAQVNVRAIKRKPPHQTTEEVV